MTQIGDYVTLDTAAKKLGLSYPGAAVSAI